jgi:hypothetical protein
LANTVGPLDLLPPKQGQHFLLVGAAPALEQHTLKLKLVVLALACCLDSSANLSIQPIPLHHANAISYIEDESLELITIKHDEQLAFRASTEEQNLWLKAMNSSQFAAYACPT